MLGVQFTLEANLFLLKLLKTLDVNFVQKCQNFQTYVIYENLNCIVMISCLATLKHTWFTNRSVLFLCISKLILGIWYCSNLLIAWKLKLFDTGNNQWNCNQFSCSKAIQCQQLFIACTEKFYEDQIKFDLWFIVNHWKRPRALG